MSKVSIEAIKVRDRYRTDLGDVSELSKSIADIGLLNPVILDGDRNLIAGLRRIEAARALGWTEIDCRIVSEFSEAKVALKAERDENTCRLGFKPTELAKLGMALEKLERPKAEARMKSGKSEDGSAGGRGIEKPRETLSQGLQPQTRTREIVGDAIGMSGITYERAKAVVIAADEDPETYGPIAEEMDRTGKVSPAYNKMNDIKKGENAEDDETVSQSPTPKTSDNGAGTTRQRELAFSKAVEAINCLKSISASNPARKRAFQKVGDYIKHNIKEMK